MTNAFISYSYSYREDYRIFDEKLLTWLNDTFGINAYSFVFDYRGNDTCYLMMQEALKLIDASELLIAEMTYKPIGVGAEVGYAKGKGKKIIYIHQQGSEVSRTVRGISDFVIAYDSIDDLILKLDEVVAKLTRINNN